MGLGQAARGQWEGNKEPGAGDQDSPGQGLGGERAKSPCSGAPVSATNPCLPSLVCSTFSYFLSQLPPGHSGTATSYPRLQKPLFKKLVFNGCGVSFGENDKVLEMDGGDGCTTV